MINGFAPLSAELLDALGCDEVEVGILKYISIFAVLLQVRHE